jgi:hypothetical protein
VPSSLATFSRMLRHGPTSAQTAIDPRLVTMVGMVSDHFGGRPLNVVSGFRPYSPTQYTAHSNHNVGRAMDFNVEGVPNTVLRDYCHTFRNAGVGYYPNSSFVHLDARSGRVTWIDYSKAGEAPNYDSPGSRQDADEAARDVYDTPGSGSDSTSKTDTQPSDPTNGKQGSTDAAPKSGPSTGPNEPTAPESGAGSTPSAPATPPQGSGTSPPTP